MRVLSFIPAFIVAAAGFVAAAPTSPAPVSLGAVSSCVPATGTGTGSDAALQPVIEIIAKATADIQPLSGKLSAANSGTPDANVVADIVVEIGAVIDATVTALKAEAKVDLSIIDVTRLYVTVEAFISLTLTVLYTLVAIVVALRAHIVAHLQTVIVALLHSVLALVVVLQGLVVVAVSDVVGTALVVVSGAANLLLSIVVSLQVFVGVGA